MDCDPARREMLHLMSSVYLTGLAGCISGEENQGGDDNSAQSHVETSSGLVADLSLSATVLQSFTQDHPGRIEVKLTNQSNNPLAMGTGHGIEGPISTIEGVQTDGDGRLVIFGDPPGETHETPPGVRCRSDEFAIPDTPTDGCWEPACEYSKLHSHYAITIPVNETLFWPYVVLDGFNDTCIPAGTYEFIETSPFTPLEA